MFEQVSMKIEAVTPERAQALLALNTFNSQRVLRPKWADALAAKIRDGRFRCGEIATAENGDGRKVLMNGQHQLTGIIQAALPVKCVLEHYRCPTGKDMADLFRQFDCTPRRSLSDMAKVEADALELRWPVRIVSLIVSATDMRDTGMHSGRQAWEKVEQLRLVIPEGEFVNRIFGGRVSDAHRHLLRAPVVTMMMRTWRKAHSDAEMFWVRVRDGEMLSRRQPEYLLREFLQTNGANIGHSGGLPKNRLVTGHEFLYRCAIAWNAFRQGKDLSVFKYLPDKPVPKCL